MFVCEREKGGERERETRCRYNHLLGVRSGEAYPRYLFSRADVQNFFSAALVNAVCSLLRPCFSFTPFRRPVGGCWKTGTGTRETGGVMRRQFFVNGGYLGDQHYIVKIPP